MLLSADKHNQGVCTGAAGKGQKGQQVSQHSGDGRRFRPAWAAKAGLAAAALIRCHVCTDPLFSER